MIICLLTQHCNRYLLGGWSRTRRLRRQGYGLSSTASQLPRINRRIKNTQPTRVNHGLNIVNHGLCRVNHGLSSIASILKSKWNTLTVHGLVLLRIWIINRVGRCTLFSFLGFLTRCEFYLQMFLMRQHCTNNSKFVFILLKLCWMLKLCIWNWVWSLFSR
jgi:hypothetical protein